jgi:hypothetical protein
MILPRPHDPGRGIALCEQRHRERDEDSECQAFHVHLSD